ncbi:thyroid receptor-interacting 11, putative [Babesia caballi]|uniref:Thyroid receptor-interacting 11, putative n=1 Tax=Babesia caballi TaxID=5871 RepID=A0AAV4LX58_BABCB|nr:thyroid receptor-interacting 11, putative [Babesia caballi]
MRPVVDRELLQPLSRPLDVASPVVLHNLRDPGVHILRHVPPQHLEKDADHELHIQVERLLEVHVGNVGAAVAAPPLAERQERPRLMCFSRHCSSYTTLAPSGHAGRQPEGCAAALYQPAGFRVYKTHRCKKHYERDYRRRLRNLTVVESRFADELAHGGRDAPSPPEQLLTRLLDQMEAARPQLVEYLKRSPDSLAKRLNMIFGVPVCVDCGSLAANGHPAVSADHASSTRAVSDASCASFGGPELLASVLRTLSERYDTIVALESQVSELSRENTELSLKLSAAYSDLTSLELESARTEQRYLEALTGLTETTHVAATQSSRLQALVLKLGAQLSMQAQALFATEDALTRQCQLNGTTCELFTKPGVQVGSDLVSAAPSAAAAPRFESFILNDSECATSEYDSDVQGSFNSQAFVSSAAHCDPAPPSAAFYDSGRVIAPFEGERACESPAELVIAGFGDNPELRLKPLPAAEPPRPVIVDANRANAIAQGPPDSKPAQPQLSFSGSPVFGSASSAIAAFPAATVASVPELSLGSSHHDDTKVRELSTEISVLQKKLQQYLREIHQLKRENERLKIRELPAPAVPAADSAQRAPSAANEEDTKVKELKAEISVLQKQIQRQQELAEERRRLEEQLDSEGRRNRELHSELAVARSKLANYQHEVNQLLHSHPADVNPSTTASQDNGSVSQFGSTMPELKSVFGSLQDRVSSYESENGLLRSEVERVRSELSALQVELARVRDENQVLKSDNRAASALAVSRLFESVNSALSNATRTTLEELDAEHSDAGTTTLSQLSHEQLTEERVTVLEFENQLYKDKVTSLLDILHQSSLERCQMHMTTARLNSDLHEAHQQLQKFRDQSTLLLETSNELDALRVRSAVSDDQVDRLKQMNTDLSDLNNRLVDDMRTLEEKSAFASNETAALREEIRQLQSLLLGDTRAAQDAIRDRVTIIKLEGRCKLLDDSLQGCRSELESLRGKNSDLVKSVMELRYALEQERTSNAEYLRQLKSTTEADARLRAQLSRQETQLEGLKASVASLTESVRQGAADVRSTSARLLEKERSERALTATVESLKDSLKAVFASVRDAKPIRLAPDDLGAVDLSGIPNFNLGVYYGLVDTIQETMVTCHDSVEAVSRRQEITAARDRVSNILKCNYLLGALVAGLCRQLQDLGFTVIANARSQGASLDRLLAWLGDNVNIELVRADCSNRVAKLHAHYKELKSLVRDLYANDPATSINRLKEQYEGTIAKYRDEVAQLTTVVQSKEEEHLKLRQENSKLMSDCSSAAAALAQFDKKMEALMQERSSLCSFALSLLPPGAQSECERDNLRGILAAVRSLLSKLAVYRDKYKKLLENPPEPKVVTVTVPAPAPAQAPAPVPHPPAAPVPAVDNYPAPGSSTSMYHSCGHADDLRADLRADPVPRPVSPPPKHLERLVRHLDDNLRFYVRNIKSTLRDYVRDLSAQADTSDTDYESPDALSVGRSDATFFEDELDSEPAPEAIYFDKEGGEELLRSHQRQFEDICDMLYRVRDMQSQLLEQKPRVVYVDVPAPAPPRPPASSASDMAVMHHFHQLCAALKECTAGSPLALTVDDVFYQLERVVLDQGDRERRRAKWDRCVGDMVSVAVEVLRSIFRDRRSSLDELRRRYQVSSSALVEAQSLCRLREEELHRRTTELSSACNRVEELERHCRKLEVELDARVAEPPRVDEQELRALESDLSYKEEEVRRLTKEVSQLHSIVFDLEEVNGLLSQQLSRARSESERLSSTVESQQRKISGLNSELALLEVEAERLRQGYV